MAEFDIFVRKGLAGENVQVFKVAPETSIETLRAALEKNVPAFHVVELIIGGRKLRDVCVAQAGLQEGSEVQSVVTCAQVMAIEYLEKASAELKESAYNAQAARKKVEAALKFLSGLDCFEHHLCVRLLDVISANSSRNRSSPSVFSNLCLPGIDAMVMKIGEAFGRACPDSALCIPCLIELCTLGWEQEGNESLFALASFPGLPKANSTALIFALAALEKMTSENGEALCGYVSRIEDMLNSATDVLIRCERYDHQFNRDHAHVVASKLGCLVGRFGSRELDRRLETDLKVRSDNRVDRGLQALLFVTFKKAVKDGRKERLPSAEKHGARGSQDEVADTAEPTEMQEDGMTEQASDKAFVETEVEALWQEQADHTNSDFLTPDSRANTMFHPVHICPSAAPPKAIDGTIGTKAGDSTVGKDADPKRSLSSTGIDKWDSLACQSTESLPPFDGLASGSEDEFSDNEQDFGSDWSRQQTLQSDWGRQQTLQSTC